MIVFLLLICIFFGDPPLVADSGCLDHKGGDYELLSFVHGSNIVVYVLVSVASWFKVVANGDDGALICFMYKGLFSLVRGVYLLPEMTAQ